MLKTTGKNVTQAIAGILVFLLFFYCFLVDDLSCHEIGRRSLIEEYKS